jgi:hypothetical protein
MWEPQPLTTLRASKACRGENFTLFTFKEEASSKGFSDSSNVTLGIIEFLDVHQLVF